MDELTSGQLYIKVVEASELLIPNDRHINPYVKINFEGVNKSITTDVIPSTFYPRWNEEFVINVLSKYKTILIDILDKANLSKDKIIGKCQFYLNDIENNKNHELNLPLEHDSAYENFRETLINSRVDILIKKKINKSEKVQLDPGTYIYPFKFDLPPYIPPSFKYSTQKIIYYNTVKINDTKIKTSINVSLKYPRSQLVKVMSLTGTKGNLIKKSEDIKVDIKSNEVAFIGEPHLIRLIIKNNGKKPINEIYVKLLTYIYISYKGRISDTTCYKKEILNSTLKNMEGFPILPGTIYEGKFKILIPDNAFISIKEDRCKSIRVENILKFKILSTNGTYSKIDFDLLIGSREKNVGSKINYQSNGVENGTVVDLNHVKTKPKSKKKKDKNKSRCLSCKKIKPFCIIVPCEHKIICFDCGQNLYNNNKSCPKCDVIIETVWPLS